MNSNYIIAISARKSLQLARWIYIVLEFYNAGSQIQTINEKKSRIPLIRSL